MQHQDIAALEYMDEAPGPSIDLVAILAGILRRWKLIAVTTLFAITATYGLLRLVPPKYLSEVEILIYDPQQQINAEVQKPISPFVEDVGNDAMATEIKVLRSKSVTLRVAAELNLDRDPEFQPRSLPEKLAERLGFSSLARALSNHRQAHDGAEDENSERLDQAAEALLKNMNVWQEAYILFVTTTSHNPVMAQRLASTIAQSYLNSQREAREAALNRVATWLRARADNLQSHALETEAQIEKLKSEYDIRDAGTNNQREQQIVELNGQLMKARADVQERHARLEQVRHVIDTGGDVQSIPELTASATLTDLRQKQAQLKSQATDLEGKLGAHHLQVIALKAELVAINQQIGAEADHILGDMKNSYDIAVRQEQSLEANLQSLSAHINSEAYVKLQQLQHVADADLKLYDTYVSQYNDVSERRTLQDASARIISPATLPRSPSSPRRILFYALGGGAGLGGGFLLAFLLEYFRPGVRTGAEIERSYGRPVVGMIPLMRDRKARGKSGDQLLRAIVEEPFSQFGEAVRAMRIGLELTSADSKVILVTSALPAEGKSTAAILLSASSARSGKKTILLDCDLHQQTTSDTLQSTRRPGLSELLRGKAELADVLTRDPVTTACVISAGAMVPNAADLLMGQRMRDLIAALRQEFDCIILDTAPLLPVVDTLVLSSIADRILVIVEWSQTPRASISEALKMLRPNASRIAGIVLNKVDLDQLPEYGYGRRYRYGQLDASSGSQ